MIFNKKKGHKPFFYEIKKSSLFIISIVCVVIFGTLSHEFGHYIMARLLGYEASFNYAHTIYVDKDNVEFVKNSFNNYNQFIEKELPFPNSEKYYKLKSKYLNDAFLITSSGVLFTVLTGIFGLTLAIFGDKINNSNITFTGMLFCLFILRQPVNFLFGLYNFYILNKPNNSDEIRLANSLKIHFLTFEILTSIIALILYIKLLNLNLFRHNKTFMTIHILIGGTLGFYLWLYVLGPFLLP